MSDNGGENDKIKDMHEFTKELEKEVGLGATGKFPKGKIKKEDEGELAFAITHHKGRVVMDFGKPVQWLAIEPEMAVELANSLIKYAAEVKKEVKDEQTQQKDQKGQGEKV